MSSHKFDRLIKLLIIGDQAVGKTCLLLRYSDDSFTQNHIATIGIDFKTKFITINNIKIKLQLWDSAGEEKYRTITKSYYKGAQGIILTYDISKKESLNHIESWMKLINDNANDNVCKILIGNKIDVLNREVPKEEGEKIANNLGIKYFETSAKENINVEEAFNYLVKMIVENNTNDNEPEKLILDKQQHKKKKKSFGKNAKIF